MPTVKSRYRHIRLHRPGGTRYVDVNFPCDVTRYVDEEGDQRIISITKTLEAMTEAVRSALMDYIMEFHPDSGIPADVLDQMLVIETVVVRRGVSVTVLVPPAEDES